MNIKTKLILATAAVALFSAPASARIDGDEGGASAYPRFNGEGAYTRVYTNGTPVYASGVVDWPRATVQRPPRLHNSQPRW